MQKRSLSTDKLLFCMPQRERGDPGLDGYGEDYADGAAQAIEQCDHDGVVSCHLQEGHFVGIDGEQRSGGGAGVGQDQRVGHRTDHIVAYSHSGTEELPRGELRRFGVYFFHRRSHGDADIHHRAQAGDQNSGVQEIAHAKL